jgi:hypothetical protein
MSLPTERNAHAIDRDVHPPSARMALTQLALWSLSYQLLRAAHSFKPWNKLGKPSCVLWSIPISGMAREFLNIHIAICSRTSVHDQPRVCHQPDFNREHSAASDT